MLRERRGRREEIVKNDVDFQLGEVVAGGSALHRETEWSAGRRIRLRRGRGLVWFYGLW